jgi:transcriptional regulator with XRE-family HTH domain
LPTRKKTYHRDDAFMAQVGSRIRAIRQSKGMIQTELAFACNDMDYSLINRMELGKVNFSISLLSLLAKALDVKPKDFLE